MIDNCTDEESGNHNKVKSRDFKILFIGCDQCNKRHTHHTSEITQRKLRETVSLYGDYLIAG